MLLDATPLGLVTIPVVRIDWRGPYVNHMTVEPTGAIPGPDTPVIESCATYVDFPQRWVMGVEP